VYTQREQLGERELIVTNCGNSSTFTQELVKGSWN